MRREASVRMRGETPRPMERPTQRRRIRRRRDASRSSKQERDQPQPSRCGCRYPAEMMRSHGAPERKQAIRRCGPVERVW